MPESAGPYIPLEYHVKEGMLDRKYELDLFSLKIEKAPKKTSEFSLSDLIKNGSVALGEYRISVTPQGSYKVDHQGKQVADIKEVTFLSQLYFDGGKQKVGLDVVDVQDAVEKYRRKKDSGALDIEDPDETDLAA